MSDPLPQDPRPAPEDAGDRSAAPGAHGPVLGHPTPPPAGSVPGASLPLPPLADGGADCGLSDPAEDPGAAGPAAVARVLHEAGYELEEVTTRPHPDRPRSFERARPNQLWQTDLFTFVLRRQIRRVYLVAFLDDHSRFLVSYGLHASQSSALVLEVLRAGLASYGPPKEILTDNGSQYVTWRGKSAFSRELERLGIRQIVTRPRHPQTLG